MLRINPCARLNPHMGPRVPPGCIRAGQGRRTFPTCSSVGVLINVWMGEDEGVYEIPEIEQRIMKRDEDFAAFPGRALYKVEPGTNKVSEVAITSIEQLTDKAMYTVRQDPIVKRLEGWQGSVVAGGERAAGAAAVQFLEDKGLTSVEPLKTLGQLRYSKSRTLGQIDAGAIAPGMALLVSKKTRGLAKDVDVLWNTMQLIIQYRDRRRFEFLKEFRNRKLYGALSVDAVPNEPAELEAFFDALSACKFGLFTRNGEEYSCTQECPGLPQG